MTEVLSYELAPITPLSCDVMPKAICREVGLDVTQEITIFQAITAGRDLSNFEDMLVNRALSVELQLLRAPSKLISLSKVEMSRLTSLHSFVIFLPISLLQNLHHHQFQ